MIPVTNDQALAAFGILIRAKKEDLDIVVSDGRVLLGLEKGSQQPKWFTNAIFDNQLTNAIMADAVAMWQTFTPKQIEFLEALLSPPPAEGMN